MIVFAIAAGVALALAIALREAQLAKERRAQALAVDVVRHTLDATRISIRRAAEEVFVLRNLLIERRLIDEADVVASRARLAERTAARTQPRNDAPVAQAPTPMQTWLDDGDITLH